MRIEVTDAPLDADLHIVATHLAAFNAGEVGPAAKKPLAVLIRDDGGAIVAGLSGYTAWGWLYVQWLWVDEGLRGRNTAAALLEAAEKEAAGRSCHGAYIDTFNPTALKVYRRQGYRPFGVLEDFPKGRTRTFLAKAL